MRENLGDFAARLGAFLLAAASFFHGALLRGEEDPPGGRKFDVVTSISPNGKWLTLLVTESERQSFELDSEVTYLRETGRKLFRMALSTKKPKVFLLHETKQPDGRAAIYYSNIRYVANAIVLDDGTAMAMSDGINISRWNPAGKLSEHKVFPQSALRQLSLVTGGRRLVANRRIWGANRSITNQIVDLKTYQVSDAPFLKGLLGTPMQWSADLKHVYGIEVETVMKPITTNDGKVISSTRETHKLVRVSTRGEPKVVIAPEIPQNISVSFGKNVIVWSAKGKGNQETFWRAKKTDPPVLEEVPGLKTWIPVIALDEDRFLLRSGTERHGIVSFAATGDEAATRTPPVDLLSLPPYEDIVYTPALKAFVLSKDGITYKLIDLKGSELWQIQLVSAGSR